MAIYEYDDDFVVSAVAQEDIDDAETDVLTYLDKLGIEDEFYRRKACVCGVYIELCRQQLENEGMQDKLNEYRQCWDNVIADATAGAGSGGFGVASINVKRA